MRVTAPGPRDFFCFLGVVRCSGACEDNEHPLFTEQVYSCLVMYDRCDVMLTQPELAVVSSFMTERAPQLK